MKVLILPVFTIIILACVGLAAKERDFTIHVATWNVNGRKPTTITNLIGQNSDKYENLPDMVIVGLQEVTMSAVKAVSNALTGELWSETMEKTLKGNYQKVKSVALLGIVLNVFVKLNSAWALKNAAVDEVTTGMAGLYGNKGGVIMKFQLHDLMFCIVNAHFHAHDKGQESRIKDYKEINEGREKLCTPKSDFIFWLGDLNFRIVEKDKYTPESIEKFIKKKDYDELLANEQLKEAKDAGKIFKDYQEGKIKFAPTFKLNVDEGTYNLKRRPSWTDRVLYKSETNKNIDVLAYHSLENHTRSDHFPVMAQYKIKVPDNDKK
uniref:Salivary inositol polyphosphate 5-phosphatase n=1 Tax=Rhodnius prolixus TaxID=13249 RepID=Q95041_RHOPR|nr:salivary inositol polyphosphate 5-phosphatase [Rhodnius prolixus]